MDQVEHEISARDAGRSGSQMSQMGQEQKTRVFNRRNTTLIASQAAGPMQSARQVNAKDEPKNQDDQS